MIWLRKWGMWLVGGVVALFVFLSARAGGKRSARAKEHDRSAGRSDDQADAIDAKLPEMQRQADAATARREEVEADVEAEREARRSGRRSGGDRMDDLLGD